MVHLVNVVMLVHLVNEVHLELTSATCTIFTLPPAIHTPYLSTILTPCMQPLLKGTFSDPSRIISQRD